MQQRTNYCSTAIVLGAIMGIASVTKVADCQSIQSQRAAEQNWRIAAAGFEVAQPDDSYRVRLLGIGRRRFRLLPNSESCPARPYRSVET